LGAAAILISLFGWFLALRGLVDVAKVVFGLEQDKEPQPMCGIEIVSSGSWAGNLRMGYEGQAVLLPLEKLKNITSGNTYVERDILLHVDNKLSDHKMLVHRIIPITTWITTSVFYTARIAIFVALFMLAVILSFPRGPIIRNMDLTPVFLVSSLAASIALPRLVLFAAIDANMYQGTSIRYMATGSLAVWLFSGFIVSYMFVSLNSPKRVMSLK